MVGAELSTKMAVIILENSTTLQQKKGKSTIKMESKFLKKFTKFSIDFNQYYYKVHLNIYPWGLTHIFI